ncbi:uncharacterized protein LOC129314395 [Prosopis cineraria]|uniref:uncharacterized protein LOC129295436 n=1 Tax=Prosopis cineraria TaxID=364024 RepID=UPI0024101F86|nr:uncharacterized protein LOC129295436 [Prosopis cineraria]XP_054813811.1 uncharacterized protein LOC129314395 [Prosopis cineraria]
MGSSAEEEYAAFLEKVERTVYFDNLSPQVTESVLIAGIDQFATVESVKLIRNYNEPRNMPICALVELDSATKAKEVISVLSQNPFMMCGMPRPVRVRQAEVEMFDDRPKKPGRKIDCQWLEPDDPDFKVVQELKRLTHKHTAEAARLMELQLQEEEKLQNQQTATLKGHYDKLKKIESIMADGNARRLARKYDLRLLDD